MQREDDRDLVAQPGQHTQVEVAAVQVVGVDNVWELVGERQQLPCAREAEVLAADVVIERLGGIPQRAGHAPQAGGDRTCPVPP